MLKTFLIVSTCIFSCVNAQTANDFWMCAPQIQMTYLFKPELTENPEQDQIIHMSTPELVNHIFSGSLFGFFFGAGVGVCIQYYQYENALKGGIIGASILSVLNYERIRSKKGIERSPNSWQINIGTNITNTNFNSSAKPGISIGFGRNYKVTSNFGFRADYSYTKRKFIIPNANVLYPHYHYLNNPLRNQDIVFDFGYFDISFMPNFTYKVNRSLSFLVLAGPLIAVPVYDKTKYVNNYFLDAEKDNYNFKHSDGSPPIRTYIGLKIGGEIVYKKYSINLTYDQALRESSQIFALDKNVQLNTFMISLGYNF